MPAAEITAEQCRAARMMLGLEQGELAVLAQVAAPTVKRFENRRDRSAGAGSAATIRAALEAAGAGFVMGNDGGLGVRLKKPIEPELGETERPDIVPAQYRAARGLAGITQQRLADMAGLGVATVRRLEAGSRDPLSGTLGAVRRAYAALGVTFTRQTAAFGPGVRLRRPASDSDGGDER